MGNLNNYIVKIKEKYSDYLNNPEILELNLSDDEIDDLVVEEIKKRFSLDKVEKRWYQWYLGRWGREMCYIDLKTKRGFKAEFKFDYDSKLDDDEDFDLEDLIEKKIKERYDEELKKSLYSYSFGYHFY